MASFGLNLLSWISLSASLLLPLVPGCARTEDTEDSSLKWGLLSHAASTGLLTLEPNSKICLRGYHAQEAAGAVRQWTDAVGRTGYLTIQVGCGDGHRNIDLFGPQDSACAGDVAGSTDTISKINVCQEYPENHLTHILLHETGHMWGLCDQYDGGGNCQGGTVDPNSIMGAARGLTQLTPDDIAGIRYVTSQPQLGANQAWLNLPPKPGTPGSGAPATSPQGAPTGTTQAIKNAPSASPPPAPASQSGNPTLLQQIVCQLTGIGCDTAQPQTASTNTSGTSSTGG